MSNFAAPTASLAKRRPSAAALPHPLFPVFLLLFATLAINPVGYIGGGGDDWYYLEAARCAAEEIFCPPSNHWETRFPLIVPTGAVIALLGEARATLWIVPLAYGLAAVALFTTMIERQFGRAEALIGGLALVATPAVSGRLLDLGIDITELCFVLAALFCVQSALRSERRRWAMLGGIMLALAVQSRASALALMPIAALFLLVPIRHRAKALPVALGFGGLLALEGLAYAIATGDPLRSWRLSLGHTRIPSSELGAGVDLSESPLFNIAFIDNWRPAMGIELHWTVDPILNLLAHPDIGLTLLAAVCLLILHRRSPGAIPLALLGASILYFGALTYALAIDPKPRMFLPLAAAGSAIIGILGARSWRDGGQALVLVLLGMGGMLSMIAVNEATDLKLPEANVPAWITEEHGPLAIDVRSARFLTLVPAARELPLHPAAGADRVLAVAVNDCASAQGLLGPGDWRVVRSERFAPAEFWPIAAMRSRGLLLGPRDAPALCLFSRAPA